MRSPPLVAVKICGVAVVLLAAPLLADDVDFCISGSVVNAVTGEPLRRAAVTTPLSAILTDTSGAFNFCGLPAGSYYTNAEKPGFASAGLTITVGPSRQNVQLRLQPLAVVKGRVLASDGLPLENALIQLLSAHVQNGRRKVRVEATATTDDQGEYRLAGLNPGRYLVRAACWQGNAPATDEEDSNLAFAPVYYGGATELAFATPLTVDAGQEALADFNVALETGYRVRGVVAGYSSLAPVNVELLRSEEGLGAARRVDFNAATGDFEVGAVAPGSYIVRATQGEGSQRLAGEAAVEIGASDVRGVRLTLRGTVALKGTVRVEQVSGQPSSPPGCSVAIAPAEALMTDPAFLESQTDDGGAFEIADVLPGRYFLTMNCATGYLATIHAGDVDVLASDESLIAAGTTSPAIEAVLNTDGGTLDVTATQNGKPVTARFLLLPDSGSGLHARFSIVKGQAALSEVAPGDYHAYAWTGSADDFEYASANAREAWAARAISVHVSPGDRQNISIEMPAGDTP